MKMADLPLDRRLNAFRPDLANVALRARVEARQYVEPTKAQIIAPTVDLMAKPAADAGMDAQALFGDRVDVFERKNGWAWVQSLEDGYVGYIEENNITNLGALPTHMICAPRTFVYAQQDLKSARVKCLSMGSQLAIIDQISNRGTDYLILENGNAIIAHHATQIGQFSTDYVTIAETLLHTPYLWGGNTGFGIDCSGLVWLAKRLCGQFILRDSDMQANTFGQAIDISAGFGKLQRGDLVFWKGHVGIVSQPDMLLHANGHSMNVALENLHEAIERIGYLYAQPTQVRRG